jgi:hypothetical protein
MENFEKVIQSSIAPLESNLYKVKKPKKVKKYRPSLRSRLSVRNPFRRRPWRTFFIFILLISIISYLTYVISPNSLPKPLRTAVHTVKGAIFTVLPRSEAYRLGLSHGSDDGNQIQQAEAFMQVFQTYMKELKVDSGSSPADAGYSPTESQLAPLAKAYFKIDGSLNGIPFSTSAEADYVAGYLDGYFG